MKHWICGLISAFALTSVMPPALAWPDRPINLVVPFPPGGSTDLIARTLSAELGKTPTVEGANVVVQNKPGATGTIGAGQVAKAPPDGYTLLVASLGPFVIAPHLMPVNYDALKDLDPVTVVVQAPNVLVVPAASAHASLEDVIAFQKEHPDRMTFASSGAGSSDHLTAELFWQQTGTRGIHVPYKGGGPVMSDLLANQVDASFMNINTAMPQIQSGKLRALAITSAQRSTLLPDVPTLQESGIADANVYSWQAVAAPHGLPDELKQRLYEGIAAVFRKPDVVARMQALGFETVLSDPATFARFQKTEFERWQRLIQDRQIARP